MKGEDGFMGGDPAIVVLISNGTKGELKGLTSLVVESLDAILYGCVGLL